MSGWDDWAKRKRTNKPISGVNFEENCPFCAHCTWIKMKKTNPKYELDEFYCHRVYGNGKRDTVDMTGHVPEKCVHFEVRSKYAEKYV